MKREWQWIEGLCCQKMQGHVGHLPWWVASRLPSGPLLFIPAVASELWTGPKRGFTTQAPIMGSAKPLTYSDRWARLSSCQARQGIPSLLVWVLQGQPGFQGPPGWGWGIWHARGLHFLLKPVLSQWMPVRK